MTMLTSLSLQSLPALPASVARPNYRREDLVAGIVHFGVGNFHRAHMAVYLDDLMRQGGARDWAIVGAGVTEFDAAMRRALIAQDYLTTVVEREGDDASARVTGVMVDFIDPADKAALLARLEDPAIRIVSLTITEGGYFIDPATGRFDADHPAIRADAAAPQAPGTVFGLILAGLARRRGAGTAPFTVLSCDNVPHNGDVTRNALVGLARLFDPSLAQWVEGAVAFPNAMVDRITPATGARERDWLARHHGLTDNYPVFCEPFKQWVVEDRFRNGRPALEQAGVAFVPDVTPWEIMKIRILNGGHAAIAYPAGLLGIEFVDEAMAHPLVRGFLEALERREIIPCVPPVPDTSLDDYFRVIERRFANPSVGDTVRRLCLDGSNRQPKFIVPTVREALAHARPVDGLALVSALWMRYCRGVDETGAAIAPNDPNWDRLTATAQAAESDPDVWLAMADVYGATGKAPAFRDPFHRWTRTLAAEGVTATLRRYLEGAAN